MVFWGSEIGGEGCVCGIFPSLLLAYARQGENTKHLTQSSETERPWAESRARSTVNQFNKLLCVDPRKGSMAIMRALSRSEYASFRSLCPVDMGATCDK